MLWNQKSESSLSDCVYSFQVPFNNMVLLVECTQKSCFKIHLNGLKEQTANTTEWKRKMSKFFQIELVVWLSAIHVQLKLKCGIINLPIRVRRFEWQLYLNQIKLMWWVEFDVSKRALGECKRLSGTRWKVCCRCRCSSLFAKNTRRIFPMFIKLIATMFQPKWIYLFIVIFSVSLSLSRLVSSAVVILILFQPNFRPTSAN